MQLDHVLLTLFFYKVFTKLCWQASVCLCHFPLCYGASFLFVQRWKLVFVRCAGGGTSCKPAPGQQLSHICLHVDKERLQDVPLLFWLCIETWCAKVSEHVSRCPLCGLPSSHIIFLLMQPFPFVVEFSFHLIAMCKTAVT